MSPSRYKERMVTKRRSPNRRRSRHNLRKQDETNFYFKKRIKHLIKIYKEIKSQIAHLLNSKKVRFQEDMKPLILHGKRKDR